MLIINISSLWLTQLHHHLHHYNSPSLLIIKITSSSLTQLHHHFHHYNSSSHSIININLSLFTQFPHQYIASSTNVDEVSIKQLEDEYILLWLSPLWTYQKRLHTCTCNVIHIHKGSIPIIKKASNCTCNDFCLFIASCSIHLSIKFCDRVIRNVFIMFYWQKLCLPQRLFTL